MRADDLVTLGVALGDDALVLGQRLCEWVSRSPTLEEELALGNVALDHIGRARLFYGYAVEREGALKTSAVTGAVTRSAVKTIWPLAAIAASSPIC